MQKAAGRSCKTEAWYLQHVCPSVRLKEDEPKTDALPIVIQLGTRSDHIPPFLAVADQLASNTPHHCPPIIDPEPTVDTRGCIQKVNQESAATCDPCRRTCGQYEGLGGPRREWGRGVVAVPAVWVKRVRGQMRSIVNNWPRGETRVSRQWREKTATLKMKGVF